MADHVLSVTLDPRFTRLLYRQDDLQTFLLSKRVVDLDPDDLAAYIRTQGYAAVAEIVEAIDETHWKPWAVRPEGEPVVTSQERYIGELADVFIFFMNLMLAGGVGMTALARAVDAKQKKNLERWTNGYDAKATKCRGCGRAFDDKDVKCYAGISAEKTGSLPVFAFCAEKERFIDKDGNVLQ
jgi:hypothetical protein